MIRLTRKFCKLSSLYSIVFIHILAALFWGNYLQEMHFIAAFILLYFTQYYFIDVLFLSTIVRTKKFVEKKWGLDNSFIKVDYEED